MIRIINISTNLFTLYGLYEVFIKSFLKKAEKAHTHLCMINTCTLNKKNYFFVFHIIYKFLPLNLTYNSHSYHMHIWNDIYIKYYILKNI